MRYRTGVIGLAAVLLAGCAAERALQEQAAGIARKGETRGVAEYRCADWDQALATLVTAPGVTIGGEQVERIMASANVPCLTHLEISDSTDRETISAALMRAGQPVFTMNSTNQVASSIVEAIANSDAYVITAGAAVEMARSRNQTIGQVFRDLAALGIQVFAPGAGVLSSAGALQAWAEGQQQPQLPVPDAPDPPE